MALMRSSQEGQEEAAGEIATMIGRVMKTSNQMMKQSFKMFHRVNQIKMTLSFNNSSEEKAAVI